MLCTHCNNKEATFHCKTVSNGKTTEMHLCSECAHELGFAEKYSDIFGDGMNVNSIINQFFALSGKKPAVDNMLKCPECGIDFKRFNSTGLLGCDKCYDVFAEAVETMMQRTQGAIVHNGKISGPDSEEIKKQNEISKLKSELQKAILEEKYEDAAKLRDSIKALEKGERADG
ncbi:MAG: UvrB/UvrC motif-containing protein [Clostridia bacterium]|nr:UvrB/UvrC motif-containing protein [Clostridia bacterium]